MTSFNKPEKMSLKIHCGVSCSFTVPLKADWRSGFVLYGIKGLLTSDADDKLRSTSTDCSQSVKSVTDA